MSEKGTLSHKIHSATGLGFIIGLPFAICAAIKAIQRGSDGLIGWVSEGGISAVGFCAFFIAALWYCKLEFDEVIFDYFDGNVQRFCLQANRLVAIVTGAIVLITLFKFAQAG